MQADAFLVAEHVLPDAQDFAFEGAPCGGGGAGERGLQRLVGLLTAIGLRLGAAVPPSVIPSGRAGDRIRRQYGNDHLPERQRTEAPLERGQRIGRFQPAQRCPAP